MFNFLLGPFLSFLPIIVFSAIALGTIIRYINSDGELSYSLPSYRTLARSMILFYILYACILTVGQYYVWSQDPTQTFLNSPIDSSLPIPIVSSIPWFQTNPLGYFVLYSFIRFWIQPLLSIAMAYAFLYFLKILVKYRARFFEEGDVILGFLTALIVGWPAIIVFLIVTFLSVLIISVIRLVRYNEQFTTLGPSFIIGMIVGLFAANTTFIELLGFGVLRI